MSADELLTFWGRLRKDNSLVTSEGTLREVIYDPEMVAPGMYGYFLVARRSRKYQILKFLSETIVKQLVPSSR